MQKETMDSLSQDQQTKSHEESRVEKWTSGQPASTEQSWEMSLRPQGFDEFPGQDKVKEKLKIFVEASLRRPDPLDHILFSGPPGLGKTTLAHIIARALGVSFKSTSGPALSKKGDLAAVLTSLEENSVLFIDEIHRLSKDVEEYLYSAMEDFFLDLIAGEGLGARTMRFKLKPFTLIGATTRAGLLKAPFRDRFGIAERLQFYEMSALEKILERSARLLKVPMEEGGAAEISRRSRGTPRVANRLLRRVRDYAEVLGNGVITTDIAKHALNELEVDPLGLEVMDRRLLMLMYEKFDGGPVGIDTLAAALSEETDTIEEVHEPFLLQEGFLVKTPRGRMLTPKSRKHLEEMENLKGIGTLKGSL